MAPKSELEIAEKISMFEISKYFIKPHNRKIGASFWSVNIIRAWGQSNPSIIWGNQKWNGALPILISSEVKRIK